MPRLGDDLLLFTDLILVDCYYNGHHCEQVLHYQREEDSHSHDG